MVDTNSHNVDAAVSSAVEDATTHTLSADIATRKLSDADAVGEGAGGDAPQAPKDALKGSQDAAQSSVASRRLAHGLSPEATSDGEVPSARRKGKDVSAEERMRKVQREHKAKITRLVIVVILLVLLLGIFVGFWLVRWGLHDDAASIQGKWRVQGTDTTIEIDDEKIILTDEVAYDYVLDPDAKTLTFKFGALTGNGRYRFSLNHDMLAIDDGEFDSAGTLLADIPWTFDALTQKLIGNQEKSPELEDGDMVLERVE